MKIFPAVLVLLQIIIFSKGLSSDGYDGKSPFIFVGGNCWELEIDRAFIARKLWPEILRITGSDPGLQFPEGIEYFYSPEEQEKSADKNGRQVLFFGRYYTDVRQIRIYLLNTFVYAVNFFNDRKIPIEKDECLIYVYIVVAHELLHHVYRSKNDMPVNFDHLHMKNSGDFGKAADFIGKNMGSAGFAKAISFQAMNWSLSPAAD